MKNNLAIQCGVIGVGYLGQHHARIYSQLQGCQLAGVYDIDFNRAQEVADRHNCIAFTHIDQLIASCQAVSVVTPTPTHFEIATQLLSNGLHVLIEKPLCSNIQEAEVILKAAKEANRIVQVGHIEHFNPVMSFLEQQIVKPVYITSDRLALFNPRGTDVSVVLDLMIHDIGIVLQLVKSPILNIQAVGVPVLTHEEDIANARITFQNGAVANLNASRVSSKKLREIRVFQKNAYLSLDFMNQQGHMMVKDADQQLKRIDIPLEKTEPLFVELDSFIKCVQQESTPKVDLNLGTLALDVALEISSQIKLQHCYA